MRLSKMLFAGILVASCTAHALAQTNVGQVLDGGATKVSAEQFRQEIVGRYVVGPIRSGSGTQEVIYFDGGIIRGSGLSAPIGVGAGSSYAVEGTWKFDEFDRICESTRIGVGTGAAIVLAPRCQVWFKQSDQYFVADSDTDRSARVVVRSIKKP